jgi:hypothetical protein
LGSTVTRSEESAISIQTEEKLHPLAAPRFLPCPHAAKF